MQRFIEDSVEALPAFSFVQKYFLADFCLIAHSFVRILFSPSLLPNILLQLPLDHLLVVHAPIGCHLVDVAAALVLWCVVKALCSIGVPLLLVRLLPNVPLLQVGSCFVMHFRSVFNLLTISCISASPQCGGVELSCKQHAYKE